MELKKGSRLTYVMVAVLVCLMACGTMGLPNAYGVFYKPMASALDLGIGAVTLQVSICSITIGLFSPVVSLLVAQGRPMRLLMGVGLVLIALSGVVIALSRSLPLIYVASAVRGVGLSVMSMLTVFVVGIVLVTTLAGHMSGLAQDYGYGAQLGGLLLSASMVGNVASKFLLGTLADRFGVFNAITCSLTTSACGLALILLNPGGEAALLAAGFLFGTSFSIGSLGISLLTRHMYGDAQYADAYSALSVVTSVASAAGVSVEGLAYDVTGSYAVPISAGLALVAIAAGCLAFLRTQAAKGDRRRAGLTD